MLFPDLYLPRSPPLSWLSAPLSPALVPWSISKEFWWKQISANPIWLYLFIHRKSLARTSSVVLFINADWFLTETREPRRVIVLTEPSSGCLRSRGRLCAHVVWGHNERSEPAGFPLPHRCSWWSCVTFTSRWISCRQEAQWAFLSTAARTHLASGPANHWHTWCGPMQSHLRHRRFEKEDPASVVSFISPCLPKPS